METYVQFGCDFFEDANARCCRLFHFCQDAALVGAWACTVWWHIQVWDALFDCLAWIVCISAVTAILWNIGIASLTISAFINIKILFLLWLSWDSHCYQVRDLAQDDAIIELAEVVHQSILADLFLERFDPLHDHLFCWIIDFKILSLKLKLALTCLTSELRTLILQFWKRAHWFIIVTQSFGFHPAHLFKHTSIYLLALFCLRIAASHIRQHSPRLTRLFKRSNLRVIIFVISRSIFHTFHWFRWTTVRFSRLDTIIKLEFSVRWTPLVISIIIPATLITHSIVLRLPNSTCGFWAIVFLLWHQYEFS